jgi:zinc transporter 5/7
LHILADTLGSVGVIISSILIERFGWMIADPICSIIISGLILTSVYPLMKESLGILMMRTPPTIEHYLTGAYQKVFQIPGVVQIHEPHFWTLCTGSTHGTLRLQVATDCNVNTVVASTKTIFRQVGVNNVTVEVTFA